MNDNRDEASRPVVILGRFVGVHGIRGALKVLSWTEPREEILNLGPWLLGSPKVEKILKNYKPVKLASGRIQGKALVVTLPGITDRTQAEGLIGQMIAIRQEDMPESEPNTWYWSDLVGLQVKTLEGHDLGKLTEMMVTGANDVMVVKGERERTIPFVHGQYVKDVDLDAGIITVDWDHEF